MRPLAAERLDRLVELHANGRNARLQGLGHFFVAEVRFEFQFDQLALLARQSGHESTQTDRILLGDRPDEAPHLACNVASGRETRIDEAVAAVAEGLGIASGSWRFSGEVAPGAPSCWRADISWLERLGFVPAVAFDEGVRRTVAAALGEPGRKA